MGKPKKDPGDDFIGIYVSHWNEYTFFTGPGSNDKIAVMCKFKNEFEQFKFYDYLVQWCDITHKRVENKN